MPLVSVCVPSYNAERFVAGCLSSVLAQTMSDWELIVVDDCSTDATFEIARNVVGDRGIVRRNATNLGPVANWNAVVAAATSPFVKVLCSDDLLEPECLARQVEALRANPSAGFVGAKRHIIDEHDRVLIADYGLAGMRGLVERREALRRMVRSANTPWGEPSVALFRADVLASAGPFRGDYGTLVDVDMFARVLQIADAYALGETVARFRVSRRSWSNLSHHVQVSNARRLLRDIRRDEHNDIDRWSYSAGLVRAGLVGGARRTAFALATARADRRARVTS